ncbi:MOP flippase family protein [Coleofasciculus chthonoplastes]|jgi:O-antigen/teichoic acid export membrane protein|uniref:MOP flippase family protein n=1 Tax=Coleofasciculus chthonoplastes TaxID=64178 RepID=UPI0032F0C7F9
MSIKQKAIKAVIWSAIQNWGSQAGSLIVFVILARLLTPEAFGIVALANVFLAFMNIFLDQGFAKALIQRQDLEPEHLDTAFWTHVSSGIVLTGLSFITAGLVADLFEQPQLIPILQCFSFLFFINSLSHVQKAILMREFAFQTMATRALLGIFIGGFVGIVMALWGFGVWSLVTQQFLYEFVEVFVLWGASDWRPRFKFSLKHFQDLFSFGINIVILQFINFFNKRSDNLLIGYFLGDVALGYYAIAYRVFKVMTQLLVFTTKQVALPTFSRLQTEPERFRKAFYKATKFTSLVAFPTFLGMTILAPELVFVLFGEKWIPAVPVMQVLAFAGIINSISLFKGSVFMAMGKPSWKLKIGLLHTALNLVGFLVAVRWGIVAVALAYVISSYIIFPISQWAISKLIKTPLLIYLKQFMTPLVSSFLMVVCILIAKKIVIDLVNQQVLLVVCIFIGTLIYVLTIRIIDPELFQELRDIPRGLSLFSKENK